MSWIEVATSIAEALAVVTAAGVAAWGLNTWRREFIGKRRAELAEETLAMFYEARDHIDGARRRGRRGGEEGSRALAPREEDALEHEVHTRHSWYVAADILEEQGTFWAKFFAARYRFAAVFGRENEEPFRQVYRARNRIISAADTLSANEPHLERLPADMKGTLVGYFIPGGTDDEIKAEVDRAIEAVEEVCRPAIDARACRAPERNWISRSVALRCCRWC